MTTTVKWWDWEHQFTADDHRIVLCENDAWYEYFRRQTDTFDQWMKSLDQRYKQWKSFDIQITYTRGTGVAPYWMQEVGTLTEMEK